MTNEQVMCHDAIYTRNIDIDNLCNYIDSAVYQNKVIAAKSIMIKK